MRLGMYNVNVIQWIFERLRWALLVGSMAKNDGVTSTTRKQVFNINFFNFQHQLLTNVETTDVSELNVNIDLLKTNVNIQYTTSIAFEKPMSYNMQ